MLRIEGTLPSTAIGKMYVYYNFDMKPMAGVKTFNSTEPVLANIATLQLAQIISSNPSLYMQQEKDIKEISTNFGYIIFYCIR